MNLSSPKRPEASELLDPGWNRLDLVVGDVEDLKLDQGLNAAQRIQLVSHHV